LGGYRGGSWQTGEDGETTRANTGQAGLKVYIQV
jgi:hypothetical protein